MTSKSLRRKPKPTLSPSSIAHPHANQTARRLAPLSLLRKCHVLRKSTLTHRKKSFGGLILAVPLTRPTSGANSPDPAQDSQAFGSTRPLAGTTGGLFA